MGSRLRVYAASRTVHAPMWHDLRDGHPELEFTSSWIDGDLIDEADTEALSDLWTRCIAEVCSSDAVIAHHEPGDVWKGAFVEIGAALASGIPIHLVGDPPGSWTRHPLVVRHVRLDRAISSAVTGHR